MVAITVILAAVIAAFVLDLGQGTGANPSASYDIEEDSGDYYVTITTTNRLDNWGAYCGDRSNASLGSDDYTTSNWNDVNIGEQEEVTNDDKCSSEDDVTIIGVYDGNEATL